MRILLTGSKGFIGSNLLRKLDETDHITFPHHRQLGDLCDPNYVKWMINTFNPTHIWHCAADPTTKLDESNFSKAFQNNTLSTQNLCHYTPKECKFIFLSSILVYGDNSRFHNVLHPTSIYGAGKIACESIVRAYSTLNEFDYSILRICATVGPNMTHGLLKDLIRKCQDNTTDTIELFGECPGSIKPFLHVDELYDAMIRNNDYNYRYSSDLASENSISVDEVLNVVEKELGVVPKTRKWCPEKVWKGDNRLIIGRNHYPVKFTAESAIAQAVRENVTR